MSGVVRQAKRPPRPDRGCQVTANKCPRCGSFDCNLRAYDRKGDGKPQLYRDCFAQREGLTLTAAVEYGSAEHRKV